MHRYLIALVAAFALVATPAAAQAPPPVPEVDVSHDRIYHYTNFDLPGYFIDYCGSEDGCRGVVTIRTGDTTVERPIDDVLGDATYDWSCNRTGVHRWTVTITHPSGPPATASGSFRVRKCTPWRARRVSRGHAAWTQARTWEEEPEFVSRVRCSPRARVVRGRASRWRCAVTHNNNYRECVETYAMKFRTRVLFGKRLKKFSERKVGRSRCRYF